MIATKPRYFVKPSEFRAWLEKHHLTAKELLVGFRKRATGKPSMTWPESVDQALCFGWIDGIRRRVDEESYTIRFTPRRQGSLWSTVNITRVAELTAAGLMQPAGLEAFGRRSDEKSSVYSYEQRFKAALHLEHDRLFKADKKAWAFFSAQAPSYRRTAIYWVTVAKGEATRLKRFKKLIEISRKERRL